MIALILLVIALACFILAAIGVGSRVGLVPLGLACWLFAVEFCPRLHLG